MGASVRPSGEPELKLWWVTLSMKMFSGHLHAPCGKQIFSAGAPCCVCHPSQISKMLLGGSLSAWEERADTWHFFLISGSYGGILSAGASSSATTFDVSSAPWRLCPGSLQLLDSRIILVDIREVWTSVAWKHLLEQNWSEIGWSGISYPPPSL